ncbi:hypothetical protein BCSAG_49490 [Bacillus cereus]
MEMGRKIVLKALTGSHNYKLATPESDEDYKVFVLPTFEDLYKGNMYANSTVTETVDHDTHDIRKLPELLFKSNIAYTELLYADKIYFNAMLNELIELRDEIMTINLPQFWKSCGGMYLNRMKKLEKGTDGTQHLVDKYGYNTKEAMHMFRTIYIPVKFAKQGFKDYEKAIKCEQWERDFLLAIKHGMFSLEEFKEFITLYHDTYFVPLKEVYCSKPVNKKLKERLEDIVMELVEAHITGRC